MDGFWVALWDSYKESWWYILEPPWRYTRASAERLRHWFVWFYEGWFAVVGLVSGALVAPSLVQLTGLVDTPYEDAFIIGVAVAAGIVAQSLHHCLSVLTQLLRLWLEKRTGDVYIWEKVLPFVVLPTDLAFMAALGYGLYRYFIWTGPGQGSITIAFVGGLLVKTFLIPLIKGIVTGALFKWFMNWLRGGKDTKTA